MIDRNLIFDIGLHKGFDAKFYAGKGFKVVGVEAVPDLLQMAKANNQQAVTTGQIIVVDKALDRVAGQTVSFYVNPAKDDWGSLFKGQSEKGIGTSIEISVATTTLAELTETFGIPYYIKCDIEGGDAIFVEQLLRLGEKPTYVSIEATSLDDLAKLRACGYTNFQIVNQYLNHLSTPPDPPREGSYFAMKFNAETSGLFGRELPLERWTDFTAMARQFLDWSSLRERNRTLALGWLDVHARA